MMVLITFYKECKMVEKKKPCKAVQNLPSQIGRPKRSTSDNNLGVHYLDNAVFLKTIVEYRTAVILAESVGEKRPRIPDELGYQFLQIATNLSNRPCFINYQFKDDMINDALENCLSGDTKVLTRSHGSTQIRDLVGKEIVVMAKDGEWRPATVENFGRQRLIEYGFDMGDAVSPHVSRLVRATANHRWFLHRRICRNYADGPDVVNSIVNGLMVGDILQTVPGFQGVPPTVISVNDTGIDEDVFCAVEPITKGFVLSNGILTGNCLRCVNNYGIEEGDPKNPFSYFTQVIYWAFLRRIKKEKKVLFSKFKIAEHAFLMENPHIQKRLGFTSNYMTDYIEAFEKSASEKTKAKKERKKLKSEQSEQDIISGGDNNEA